MAISNSKQTNLTPTEEAEEEKKVVFCNKLQQVSQEVQLHDIMCVTQDFNPRFGNDSEQHDKIMGKNGCGNINSTSPKILLSCATCTCSAQLELKLFPQKMPLPKRSQNENPVSPKTRFICYPTGQSSSLCYLIGLRSLYVDRGLFKTTQVFSIRKTGEKIKINDLSV